MLYLIVDFLPARLQDRAKALVAGALSAVATVVATGLLTGEWDEAALVAPLVGLLVGGGTYAQPQVNRRERELVGDPVDSPDVTTTGRRVDRVVGGRGDLEP